MMRIFELLHEDIDFADVYEPLIRSMYVNTLGTTSHYVRGDYSIDTVQKTLERLFTHSLKIHYQDVKLIFDDKLPKNTQGKFTATEKACIVRINFNYFREYIESLQPHILKIQEHNDYPDVGQRTIEFFIRNNIVDFCKIVCSVIMHEITHYQQYYRSDYNTNSYYSYLEKDKNKFLSILKGEFENIDKRKYYLASPQEIDAFSKTLVSRWFQNVLNIKGEKLPPKYVLALVRELLIRVQPLVNSEPLGQEYKEKYGTSSKIYKRFIKKIYLELYNIYDEYRYQSQPKDNIHDKINGRFSLNDFWKMPKQFE